MSVELIETPPPVDGVPVGHGDWTLSVEIARPGPTAALWGIARWGYDVWSQIDWTPLTADVRGIEWFRGADTPGDRPASGTALVTLDNTSGAWTPWANTYHRPGTLVRIAVRSSTDWVAQFTGLVDTWSTRYAGTRRQSFADSYVHIPLIETIGALALVDDNAGPLVGAGDTAGARLARLLEAAQWRYGHHDEAASPIPLQSTDMAINRIAEVHLTADSTDTYARSHRSGKLLLEARDPANHPETTPPNTARWGAAVWGVSQWSSSAGVDWSTARAASYYYRRIELRPDTSGLVLPDTNGRVVCQLAYDPEKLQIDATPDIILNDVRFANIGGSQQVTTDMQSQALYGRRSYVRNDLKTQQTADVKTLTERLVNRRAHRSLQVTGIELVGDSMPGMFVVDLGDPVTFVLPDYQALNGHVTALEHQITAKTPGSVNWRCRLNVELADGFVEPALIGTPT